MNDFIDPLTGILKESSLAVVRSRGGDDDVIPTTRKQHYEVNIWKSLCQGKITNKLDVGSIAL